MRKTPAAFRKSPAVTGGKSPTKHKRVDSEQFILPEENMNVSWLHGRGTWLAYVLVIGGCRLMYLFLPLVFGAEHFDTYTQWTLVNTTHAVLHYLAIHYNTGVPWTETHLMQVVLLLSFVSSFFVFLFFRESM